MLIECRLVQKVRGDKVGLGWQAGEQPVNYHCVTLSPPPFRWHNIAAGNNISPSCGEKNERRVSFALRVDFGEM